LVPWVTMNPASTPVHAFGPKVDEVIADEGVGAASD
jgi:hypothetical protein